MRLNSIRNLLPGFIGVVLLLSMPALTSASPPNSCSEPNAAGIKVELDFAASPVKTGSNEVMVKLYDASGQPIGGAEVTVMAAEMLPTEPTSHDKAENGHSPQADVQLQIDPDCRTETGASSHEPTQATEHDMAELDSHQPEQATGHDVAELDSHQPEQATEHDMAEIDSHQPEQATGHDVAELAIQTGPETGHGGGHSGGHGEPAPTELAASLTPGEYQGQVSFNAEGQWLVKVDLLVQGQRKEVEFTLNVVKRGPDWYVLGGFLSVNMLVLATAAVMKQRVAKA